MIQKLSTESYKGVRDFYPEDQFIQNYIFTTWQSVLERFGYLEYDASIIEPTDLYRAKSGEEIINEQTYTFEDRGGRDVTLRPEMTPTVARLVAARKRELTFPLRWYSMPNLFRSERPQKGRLREHWQLNTDLFGSTDIEADIEIISVGAAIMEAFGAQTSDYDIRINNRKFINTLTDEYLKLSEADAHTLGKLIDRKAKMPAEDFTKKLTEILGEKASAFERILSVTKLDELKDLLPTPLLEEDWYTEIAQLLEALENAGIENARFDPTLMRGFDYYTGIVFEIFDTDPENNRSMFGGGRYDDLLDIFGSEKVSAIGFGMGDVVIRHFLESRGLLPEYHPSARLFLCTVTPEEFPAARELARTLRNAHINVETNITTKKVSDQIKLADKKQVPYVICLGANEVRTKEYTVKELATGAETKLTEDKLSPFFLEENH